ncbi:MAG: hypothetical protein CVT48_02880 [Thermoplasmata archaeon HGW-Thermoplasmata-1]|nr:MAG: hypothetical protein CVT48_02880 [Thermoplasmata archaeon HGW-Thermoplasmata-1]
MLDGNTIPIKLNRPNAVWRYENVDGERKLCGFSFLARRTLTFDDEGEFAIDACDGRATVNEIRRRSEEKFDKGFTEEKMTDFFTEMVKRGMTAIKNPAPDDPKVEPKNQSVDEMFGVVSPRTPEGTLSAPAQIYMMLTLRCNGRCIYCFANAGKEHKKVEVPELDFEGWKKIIDDARGAGTLVAVVTGGEPFMHKDAMRIIEYLAESKFIIDITTNGVLVTDEMAKKLAELSKLTYLSVQVSLDSYKKELHDRLRPGCDYSRVVNAIRLLVENGVNLKVGSVISQATKDLGHIEETAKFVKSLGASMYRTMGMRVIGRGTELDDLAIGMDESLEIFKEIKKLGEKYPFISREGKLPVYLDPDVEKKPVEEQQEKRSWSCSACTSGLTIAPDGSILACAYFSDYDEFWGENVATKGLKWAWDNCAVCKRFRNMPIEGECKTCEYSYTCSGGCPADRFVLTGSINKPDPRCGYLQMKRAGRA